MGLLIGTLLTLPLVFGALVLSSFYVPYRRPLDALPTAGNIVDSNTSPTFCTTASDCPGGPDASPDDDDDEEPVNDTGIMCFIEDGETTGECREWQDLSATSGCVSPHRLPTAEELIFGCSGQPTDLSFLSDLCQNSIGFLSSNCSFFHQIMGTTEDLNLGPIYYLSATKPSDIGGTCSKDYPLMVSLDGKNSGQVQPFKPETLLPFGETLLMSVGLSILISVPNWIGPSIFIPMGDLRVHCIKTI